MDKVGNIVAKNLYIAYASRYGCGNVDGAKSGIGVGRFNNLPNRSLVDAAPVNASMGNATLGVRYHLSDRFVLRADYTLYSVFLSDLQSREFKAVTAGLSFFF